MGSTSASRAFSSSGCFSVSRLAPATGTANPAGLARRRLPAEFPETPANGRTCNPRDLGDEPDPTPPKASRLGRRQQPPAPLVKIRRQSLVSIFDTIRVVHSQYIEDKPALRNPLQPSTRSFRDQPKPAGIVPSSARAPEARGGPGNPGKLSDRKPAPGPLQLPPASSGPTILLPLPTASHTAPGRVSDFRFQRNGTVAQASPAVPHGRQKDQRRMSSLQMVARIKKREGEKTLNQEFDKSRFDNSWTDPSGDEPAFATPSCGRS